MIVIVSLPFTRVAHDIVLVMRFIRNGAKRNARVNQVLLLLYAAFMQPRMIVALDHSLVLVLGALLPRIRCTPLHVLGALPPPERGRVGVGVTARVARW